MTPLVETAFRLYREADIPPVVCSAIPILFFGDLKRYCSSRIRIVTVGLNPSVNEFPKDNRFRRFPDAEHLSTTPADEKIVTYLRALSRYFHVDPYTGWFDPSYEPVLQGMGASYYRGRAENVALHTDFCSPLATSSPWSDLTANEQNALLNDGPGLWHELIECLEPDVVILSIRRAYRAHINFPCTEPWWLVDTFEGANPYPVKAARCQLCTGTKGNVIFVWGRAARRPFGPVTRAVKRQIGARVLELWNLRHEE